MSFPGGGSIGREGHCSFNAYLPATTLNTRGDLPVRSIAVAALAVMFSMVLLAGCGSNVGKFGPRSAAGYEEVSPQQMRIPVKKATAVLAATFVLMSFLVGCENSRNSKATLPDKVYEVPKDPPVGTGAAKKKE
jgi:hypothetical protein